MDQREIAEAMGAFGDALHDISYDDEDELINFLLKAGRKEDALKLKNKRLLEKYREATNTGDNNEGDPNAGDIFR